MLKRYQIILTDWLGEHLAAISDKYDISISEAARIVLCLQIPKLVSVAYPKHKVAISDRDLVTTIKRSSRDTDSRADLHRLLSDIYFEARKAIEFWAKEEKKRKGKVKP
ncbi:MAG: hypothetical protein JSW40_00240 [Candidatus Omnitrophota bacterium]|nr:MAG: hypothetical protein JSW40_00240 [Candidatus Omnitrophota bacterium]